MVAPGEGPRVCEIKYGRMRVQIFAILYNQHDLSIVTCFLGGGGVVVANKQAL